MHVLIRLLSINCKRLCLSHVCANASSLEPHNSWCQGDYEVPAAVSPYSGKGWNTSETKSHQMNSGMMLIRWESCNTDKEGTLGVVGEWNASKLHLFGCIKSSRVSWTDSSNVSQSSSWEQKRKQAYFSNSWRIKQHQRHSGVTNQWHLPPV